MSSTCFTANCTSLATQRPVLGVTPLRRTGMTKRTGFAVTSPQPSSVRREVAVDVTGVVEIAQIAEADAGLIWSTAAISFACVLVGIAIGFVLLRAESLVEDGTIKL